MDRTNQKTSTTARSGKFKKVLLASVWSQSRARLECRPGNGPRAIRRSRRVVERTKNSGTTGYGARSIRVPQAPRLRPDGVRPRVC